MDDAIGNGVERVREGMIELDVAVGLNAGGVMEFLNAADLLNDRVLSFFESQDLPLLRILTDRSRSVAAGVGSEYCGNVAHHEYQLYLAVEDIDHSRT